MPFFGYTWAQNEVLFISEHNCPSVTHQANHLFPMIENYNFSHAEISYYDDVLGRLSYARVLLFRLVSFCPISIVGFRISAPASFPQRKVRSRLEPTVNLQSRWEKQFRVEFANVRVIISQLHRYRSVVGRRIDCAINFRSTKLQIRVDTMKMKTLTFASAERPRISIKP